MSETMAPTESVPGEGAHPRWPSSHVTATRGTGQESFWASFIRALISFLRAPPS